MRTQVVQRLGLAQQNSAVRRLRAAGSAASQVAFAALILMLPRPAVGKEPEVDFRRDVRPILSNHCFQCHGPDAEQREAGLRLDLRAGVLGADGQGGVVVPGRPESSELLARITSDDESLQMPPADAGKPLTDQQIDIIRRWIAQGAVWQEHWAYSPVIRPQVPPGDGPGVRNDIDRFIRAKLREQGLQPAGEADRVTLIRRLSFDLTGLPPSPEDVATFVSDDSPNAYERLVEKLLASPHHGERMAMYWLDLVRYADTNGIHGDNHRDHAPYRDYVIDAFNRNLPFDQFTIEQLAGDLLPKPTNRQRIASGYNRLNMTTREGGAQAKEYIAKYAADRVRNASTVWLGSTLGCAECHDHKYDPFTIRDFYRFGAFFADVSETAVGKQEPVRIPSDEVQQKIDSLEEQLIKLDKQLASETPELTAARDAWVVAKRKELLAAPADNQGLPDDVAGALRTPPEERTAELKALIIDYYREVAPELEPLRAQIARLEAEQERLREDAPLVLITTSVKPRMMRVLPRGNWLDDSGEVVQPGIPEFLADATGYDPTGRPKSSAVDAATSASPDGEARATRMDLARWLVARDNPLTARVFVNRLWKLAFGHGLARNVDDFGSQGALPTHPELLDWLAAEFMESGWDVRHVLRLIVTSATYRQSSQASREMMQRDPYNQWLARQGRFRLDAEMIRDLALDTSGLLNRKIGGLSVKPYQPAGYWDHLNFPKRTWQTDTGINQYRRGLYTYWCRTFLHPSLLAFDAPTREECTAERPRSNTPLQALVLLNDPTFVEAARALAEDMMAQPTAEQGITLAFARVLSREPREQETQLLKQLLDKHLAEYQDAPADAAKLLSVGQRVSPGELANHELAAWISVARVVLNLHEAITRH